MFIGIGRTVVPLSAKKKSDLLVFLLLFCGNFLNDFVVILWCFFFIFCGFFGASLVFLVNFFLGGGRKGDEVGFFFVNGRVILKWGDVCWREEDDDGLETVLIPILMAGEKKGGVIFWNPQ